MKTEVKAIIRADDKESIDKYKDQLSPYQQRVIEFMLTLQEGFLELAFEASEAKKFDDMKGLYSTLSYWFGQKLREIKPEAALECMNVVHSALNTPIEEEQEEADKLAAKLKNDLDELEKKKEGVPLTSGDLAAIQRAAEGSKR